MKRITLLLCIFLPYLLLATEADYAHLISRETKQKNKEKLFIRWLNELSQTLHS